MISASDIQNLRTRLESLGDPVLTVYLGVNAARPENQGQAHLIRLKNALSDLDAPEDLKNRVYEAVEGEGVGGRTLVLFASGDDVMERYALQVEMPESVHYGEPHVSPFALAYDENERYGFAIVDAESFRFFVNSPVADPSRAGGEEVSGFYEEVELSPGSPGPRSGSDHDAMSRRTEENIGKFFNELGGTIRDAAIKNRVRNLVLAGTKERTSEFRDRLPNEMKERVVAETHVPQGESDGEILKHLEAARQNAEYERESRLLEEARESGIRGAKETLDALQEGRVYHVLAAWELEAFAKQDEGGRWHVAGGNGDSGARHMMDVLVELADASGARLEFLRSDDEVAETPNEDQKKRTATGPGDSLLREFDGLTGLPRY
ncbi:MAG: hypothetical protein H0U65_00010 [Rubrobacter sp.]|jgi:hypothetical protein|nr:hypothetical protein [Rubrobacter sp.]